MPLVGQLLGQRRIKAVVVAEPHLKLVVQRQRLVDRVHHTGVLEELWCLSHTAAAAYWRAADAENSFLLQFLPPSLADGVTCWLSINV